MAGYRVHYGLERARRIAQANTMLGYNRDMSVALNLNVTPTSIEAVESRWTSLPGNWLDFKPQIHPTDEIFDYEKLDGTSNGESGIAILRRGVPVARYPLNAAT